MGSVHQIDIAAINRTSKWVRANLVRLRKSKSRYGSLNLPPDKQANLIGDMMEVRDHLTKLIATAPGTSDSDVGLASALQVARQVLSDCDEMLELFR